MTAQHGELDNKRVEEIVQKRPKFEVNPQEALSEEVESPQCGFWLPNGIKIREFYNILVSRRLLVKDAYEGLMGALWPDSGIFEGTVERLLEMETGSTG